MAAADIKTPITGFQLQIQLALHRILRRQLGVDMVKIDGSFIQNLGTDAEDEMFVRTLIDLAKSFGVVTVGEWVGDERTVELLEKAGVSYMQGYFFGMPELQKNSATLAAHPERWMPWNYRRTLERAARLQES